MKPTTTLARGRTPDGTQLVLTEHDGHHYLKIGNVPLMNTRAAASEQQMAEIACRQGRARRVLIGGLGFGFTLRRVLERVGEDAEVIVAELLPEIVAWNRDHLREVNGHLLDDPRVSVRETDVFDLMGGRATAGYDAILLDVDNSPDPLVQDGNARLYARPGLERIRDALTPGGRVVFWSANRDKAFARLLATVFGKTESIAAKAYPQARRPTHTLFVADRA